MNHRRCGTPSPEVQRAELRQLLLDSLPAGTVRWGRKVEAVRALGGGHEVSFPDGTTVTADLLVGADGAWSRVRPLLSDATPTYSGASFVETWLHDGDTRHPAAAQAVGGGSLFALAPGKRIQAHRERGGTLHTYVALSRPQDWFAGIDFTDSAAAVARVAPWPRTRAMSRPRSTGSSRRCSPVLPRPPPMAPSSTS